MISQNKMSSQLSAIDLLKLGDEGRKKPLLNQYWSYILGVAFGLGTGIILNFGTRRPVMSGKQLHNTIYNYSRFYKTCFKNFN